MELAEATEIFPAAIDVLREYHEIKERGGNPGIYREANYFSVRDENNPAYWSRDPSRYLR